MSRNRLDHKLDEYRNRYFSSPEKIERIQKTLAKYGDDSRLNSKLNEWLNQLSDEQRIKIFSGLYKGVTDKYEINYLAGEQIALMNCIDYCCTKKIPIPNWAAQAFHLNYTKIINYEARSWDTVFGKPHKTGVHLKAQRCEEYKNSIHKYVRERIDQGHPIDQELFDLAAIRFASNATEIKDVYYELEHKRVNQAISFYKGAEIVDRALKKLCPHLFDRKHT